MRQTRSRQHDRKCRLKSSQVKSVYFNHSSQGNSTNYYLILGPPRQGCASHKSTNKQIPPEASEEPGDTVIHFYFYFFFIHRRALLSANQRQCSSNRANVHRTCLSEAFWTPNIASSQFDEYFQLGSRTNICPVKNGL